MRGADIVYAATTSATPVFNGRDLKKGAHVNGVGSFRPTMQEIDAETVRNALVVVDGVEPALEEAGDLLVPMEAGVIDESHIHAEIGEILAGEATGRRDPLQITFFKSVGIAVQDLVAAGIILKNAEQQGLGQLLDF